MRRTEDEYNEMAVSDSFGGTFTLRNLRLPADLYAQWTVQGGIHEGQSEACGGL